MGLRFESCFQADIIDEVWAFLAPKLLDTNEPSRCLREILSKTRVEAIDQTGGDLFVRGLLRHDSVGRKVFDAILPPGHCGIFFDTGFGSC